MKAKILILSLICLFIFAYCTSPADPQIEKALNPEPNLGNPGTVETSGDDPPVILYFTEEHLFAGSHALSWSVAESPIATVTISWGTGEVPLTSSGNCVWVDETTIFTLTAIGAGGSAEAFLEIEPKKRAVLEVNTIPEVPIFHYDDSTPYYEKSKSTFTLIITEINGIGCHLNYIEITFPDGRCAFSCIYHVDPIPSGNISYLFDVCANGKPTSMSFKSYGLDDNGYTIKIKVEIPFTWDN